MAIASASARSSDRSPAARTAALAGVSKDDRAIGGDMLAQPNAVLGLAEQLRWMRSRYEQLYNPRAKHVISDNASH
jgi:hypothetical protein